MEENFILVKVIAYYKKTILEILPAVSPYQNDIQIKL